VRQVGDSLHRAFKDRAPYLVEQQGQQYGRRKAENKAIETDEESVSQEPEKVGAAEKPLETHPWASVKPAPRRISFKGDERPVHGLVGKHYIERRNRDSQRV
jgi:hypothetical protein